MVPPPLPTNEELPLLRPEAPVLSAYVRGTLLGIALGLSVVFGIAIWLNPYGDDGQPMTMETHRQMGLPPCTFKVMSGMPCPSCGMTTSFALLMHGDVWHSLQANSVGTMLAVICLAIIPWSLACVVLKRPVLIVSMEQALLRIILGFLVLMVLRWGLVLGLSWYYGTGF
ncbi:MAG: DUF2752 domain-containing protein [Gemmataceae bacterium]|nr:DUF2752 domain-containing protein [Gemmataceae bacterium]